MYFLNNYFLSEWVGGDFLFCVCLFSSQPEEVSNPNPTSYIPFSCIGTKAVKKLLSKSWSEKVMSFSNSVMLRK